MKKQLIRVLALSAAALCLAGGAQAGDVPTCPMVTWEEYTASRGWTGYDSGASCGTGSSSSCTSARGLSWETGGSTGSGCSAGTNSGWAASAPSSGGCASSRPSGSCSAAQGAANSSRGNSCLSGVYTPASCGKCGSVSCDGDCPTASCPGDSNCIFSFGAESDCTQPPSRSDENYTAQSVSPQESALYQMINEDRVSNGVQALPLDEELSAIARAKSEDMIENGYFAHESPTYGRAAQMLDEFGYEYTSVGENIARNGSVEKAHAALMSSSSHVRNILGSQWKAVGVGVANDSNGYPYVTELFVR